MYYQYHGVDDIKRMMDGGEVMSGFQVKGSNNMYVAYGQK
jgi:hypothetical protein